MNSRGAIELAIAFLAFKMGLINLTIFSALVAMTLITTLVFPIIFTKILKKNPKIDGELVEEALFLVEQAKKMGGKPELKNSILKRNYLHVKELIFFLMKEHFVRWICLFTTDPQILVWTKLKYFQTAL